MFGLIRLHLHPMFHSDLFVEQCQVSVVAERFLVRDFFRWSEAACRLHVYHFAVLSPHDHRLVLLDGCDMIRRRPFLGSYRHR